MADMEELGKMVLENLEGSGLPKIDALAALQAAVVTGLNELNGREACQRYLAMLLGNEIAIDRRAAKTADEGQTIDNRVAELAEIVVKAALAAGGKPFDVAGALQHLVLRIVEQSGGSPSRWTRHALGVVEKIEAGAAHGPGHA